MVKDRPRHVRVVGCGAAFVTTADTAWTVSPDSDSPNNLTTLALAVPLPSLAPSCSLDIRICLLDRCTSASLAQYRVNVTQLENPALAQLASVQVGPESHSPPLQLDVDSPFETGCQQDVPTGSAMSVLRIAVEEGVPLALQSAVLEGHPACHCDSVRAAVSLLASVTH